MEAVMRKRRIIVGRRARWTVEQWDRGWQLAISRLDSAPVVVRTERVFQDCLTVLDGAFVEGNGLRFELGLNALIDFCTDTVHDGVCQQWWNDQEAM